MVDWVPKLIQKIFPAMEQKLVQHCETEIVAEAWNASYETKSIKKRSSKYDWLFLKEYKVPPTSKVESIPHHVK